MGGSDFDPSVETRAPAIEVIVKWGENTLHVAHSSPPKSFFFVPIAIPIVVARGGRSTLIMPAGATGNIELPDQEGHPYRGESGTVTLEDLISSGRARSSSEMNGAHELDLPANAKAKMTLEGGLTFEVSFDHAGKSPPRGAFASFEPAVHLFIGLSFLLHIGLLAGMANMASEDAEVMDAEHIDHLLLMQKLINASDDREAEEKPQELVDAQDDRKDGSWATRAKGEEGSMGRPANEVERRYDVRGPHDNPDPDVGREVARTFGMFSLIGMDAGAGPDYSASNDPLLDDNPFGIGGHMITDPFGGGGPKAPTLRQGLTQVSGRLPPEVIQRVARQSFGRFRFCYAKGLRTNPALSGIVRVKFVIERDGAVSASSDEGSDLPDKSVVDCVVRGVQTLRFPPPEGGIVNVVYPIRCDPGD